MIEKVPDNLYILWDGDSIDGGSIDDWATAPFEGYEHVEYRRADLVDSVSALREAMQEIERLRGEVAVLTDSWRQDARLWAERLAAERQRARLPEEIVAEQADDDGLWFVATTAAEAYLQQELRRLHAAVEQGEAQG